MLFYAILGIVVLVALFLIFRDDHDKSYNRSEKKAQRQSDNVKKSAVYSKKEYSRPKAEPKAQAKPAGPSIKDQLLGEIRDAMLEVTKAADNPKGIVGQFISETKNAIDSTIKEVQEALNTSTAQTEVDVQEEVDLSFLGNLEYDEDLEENTETFDITGLRYHCTVHDCGKIVGIVRPEPSNVHDNRAQAVIRNDGKLLGYIPRTQLDWYEDFNENNVTCPFVGEIELDRSRAALIAEIKVILPSSEEFVREEIEADS